MDPSSSAPELMTEDLIKVFERLAMAPKDDEGLILAAELDYDEAAARQPPVAGSLWMEPSGKYIASLAKGYKIPLQCRECKEEGVPKDLIFCAGCGVSHKPIHRSCITKVSDHKPPPYADGDCDDSCDEVEYKEYVYMMLLLDSRYLQNKEVLHLEDIWSTWLGVPHDQPKGPYPQLYIWPRLKRLVANGPAVVQQRQYPSLVSFVGDTGSGKSTLIRALVRMLKPRANHEYAVPVPGAVSDGFMSTSSDVRLFADPRTASEKVPIFFVDCEGFDGTDDPLARRVISETRKSDESPQMQDEPLRHARSTKPGLLKKSNRKKVEEHLEDTANRVNLEWGQMTYSNPRSQVRSHPVTGQVHRETSITVVRQLYPRLLYAFSDVVCFVTSTSAKTQLILDTLFAWAKDGHERTLNQRVKPGLIIVLNKNTAASHENLGDVDQATQLLLASFQNSQRFRDLQKKWEARGRVVRTAEELILCYYDSFRVLSIPAHSSKPPAVAKQVANQIRTLYDEIQAMSGQIRAKRKSYNMDLDVSSLDAYLERSVTALARDYKNSIDFQILSDGDSARPVRFSEHLVLVMSNMVKIRKLDATDSLGGEAELVQDLTPFIAACIMAQLPQSGTHQNAQKNKQYLVDEARRGLQQFHHRFWRCESKDETGQRRCRNYWNGHEKGHQFEPLARFRNSTSSNASTPENLAEGQYTSSYDPDSYVESLWQQISSIDGHKTARSRLTSSAVTSGLYELTGQWTCLSCLSSSPTNVLPCRDRQHAICESCIRSYGCQHDSRPLIHVRRCPLGCSLTTTPWPIYMKPRTAGSRILALDGGGIRGVVELAILSTIEKEIGFGIPIQEMFDLVVGTSTGGIVALGVFERRWTLTEAKRRFQSLARQAFSLRRALSVPVLSAMIQPFCDYKYKTSGIEEALKESFGEEFMFGQLRDRPEDAVGDQVKVGVVTCIEGRYQPCLIANYSRNPVASSEEEDCLQREDQQSKDFRTWQAGRATSAAQTFFKPYVHAETSRTFVDGATVRNNPIRVAYEEDRKIWTAPQCRPDIIVSVGTGLLLGEDGKPVSKKNPHIENLKRLVPARLRKQVETGLDMVQSTLDCHREWEDFVQGLNFDKRLRENCHRLDIGLRDKPPKPDSVDSMYQLRYEVDRYLTEGASSLLASGLVFRLREFVPPDSEIINAVEFVNPQQPFEPTSVSSLVNFTVSGGTYKRYVEVQIPTRGQVWEPIGGF